MSKLFEIGSATAYTRYVQGLSDALRLRDWIYDPSWALANDWDCYQKIMRDPVAAHAIQFRKHLAAGVEWRIEPASDKIEDKHAAELVEEILQQMEGFTDARIRLAGSIFTGSSYAYLVGDRSLKDLAGLGMRAWWCPYALVDVDRRRFRRVYDAATKAHRWELWSLDREQYEPLTNPEHFLQCVYNETEDSLGYGRGLLDQVYQFQAQKSRTIQDCMAASERFGQGFLMASVENMRGPDGRPVAGADRSGTTVAQAWATELNKHRARNVLVHDARDKVELLTGFGEGYTLLKDLISYFDNAMVTAVLGSTLPTIEGDGGSRAMAEVQANSTEMLVQADRLRLSDDITRDLIGSVWRYNQIALGEAGLEKAVMPRFRIVNQQKEDPKEAAAVIASLLAAGVVLRKDEVYRKTGFTQPLPEDEVIEAPAGLAPPEGGDLDLEGLFKQRNGKKNGRPLLH